MIIPWSRPTFLATLAPEEHAKLLFGERGYALTHRQYRDSDRAQPGSGGYVVPTGPITGYSVGYTRTGKRGATLYTQKGDSRTSMAEALAQAETVLTDRQRAAFEARVARLAQEKDWP